MVPDALSSSESAHLDALVAKFEADRSMFVQFEKLLRVFVEEPSLRALYHSYRSRVKDSSHLRDKLERKLRTAKREGKLFEITAENLYEEVNDLAGVRLLHLHTAEFAAIDAKLKQSLAFEKFEIVRGPTARTWDDEYEAVFKAMGVTTVRTKRMYTSVHYVVKANKASALTAEIQVRTLAEEIWGEVDHDLNYPLESPVFACREQLLVLARVTSSCTRLVDSIYRTQAHAGKEPTS